jgi:hypothetical protein
MNIKLLKQVRKRFTITYYPDGFWLRDTFFKGPCVLLWDKENSFGYDISPINDIFTTQDATNHFKDKIIKRLANEGYGNAKKKRINNKGIQLWP